MNIQLINFKSTIFRPIEDCFLREVVMRDFTKMIAIARFSNHI